MRWVPLRFEPEVERDYRRHMLARFIPLGRLGQVLGALAFIGFVFWDVLLDPGALSDTLPVRLSSIVFFAACFAATYLPGLRTSMTLWSLLMIVIYCGYTTLLVKIFSLLPGGFVAGIGGLILGVIFIPVLTISAWQAALVLACQLASGVLAMWLLGASSFEIQNALYWVGGGVGFAIAFAYLLDVINRYAFHLERQLAEEKSRSEALLLNILPADVAARLKAREEPLADHHESVSVLFADLAGFTELSRHLTAEELVDLLNDLFSRFDRLAVEHGAEKIKTIGDAYMVATGLSGSVADHAERIADLALGMQQAFGRFRAERGLDLKLRIGVHSGAVIAGVIGEQKFSYDLWGDTVNVASRMESGGLPDRIQISVETREQLPERYRTTARGEIELKGHQARRAFLLEPANHE